MTANADGFADVTTAAEAATAGREIVAVGVPRFQLADPEGVGPLVLRARTRMVFAEDAHSIAIWDSATGAPLRRITPKLDASPLIYMSFAVSADGEWMATGSANVVRLFRRPFDKPVAELPCYAAHAFSHDGKLLACSTGRIEVWDVAQRKRLAPSPPDLPRDPVREVTFAPDDRSLVWRTQRTVMRWEFAGNGAVTTVYPAAARIEHASIAASGSTAYLGMTGKTNVIVDLATGKATSAPAGFGASLSPSGKLLAVSTNGVIQIVDLATRKATWSAKVAAPATRLGFGETDEVVGWVEADRIHVAMPSAGQTMPAPTSRFAGWLGPGVAALSQGDVLRALTLQSRQWAPADRGMILPKPHTGAPSWARWFADAPGDRFIAAEASKRHDLPAGQRGGEPCNPKLHIWTKAGGMKTLAMACTAHELDGHEDPGWELGGGWAIGLSATRGILYDAQSGRRIASLEIPSRRNTHPETAPTYWQAAFSPSGEWLALIWRRAVLEGAESNHPPDPREDALHVDEAATTADCVSGEHGCFLEYFVELWTMKGTPKRIWQRRLDRASTEGALASRATPSGAVTFDNAGAHLLIGFDDGEIRSVSTTSPELQRAEHLHVTAIRSVLPDPGGQWVFSADSAGEQRLWRLAP